MRNWAKFGPASFAAKRPKTGEIFSFCVGDKPMFAISESSTTVLWVGCGKNHIGRRKVVRKET
jgi:hypothetical protein